MKRLLCRLRLHRSRWEWVVDNESEPATEKYIKFCSWCGEVMGIRGYLPVEQRP